MKKWMAAIGLVVLLLVGVNPATVTNAASEPSESVWVGGEELKPESFGGSVNSTNGNGGSATLQVSTSEYYVLVLDNYVYEGPGYEYETGKYAGIYYAGTKDLYIILGNAGTASDNAITVTAENATYSYGIYVPDAVLHMGGSSKNSATDSITVTAGASKQYSAGIRTGVLKTYSSVQTVTVLYRDSKGYVTEKSRTFDGDFTLTARGGVVSDSNYTYSHGIWLSSETETTSTWEAGTINAIGGQATAKTGNSSYTGFSYGIRTVKKAKLHISGATVTARGGDNSVTVDGSTARTSYGAELTDFELSNGSFTAIGGDITGTDSTTTRNSYGLSLSGSGTFSGGVLTAAGGKTIKGWSYGIYSVGDIAISGNAQVTAQSNGTTDGYKYGILTKGDLSVADTASVTANASDGNGLYAHYGIYLDDSNGAVSYTQTGGTVLATAYSAESGIKNAGISLGSAATISGGTFTGRATVKGIGATDLIINGGTVTGISEIHNDIKPAADATSYGISAYSLVLTDGELIGTGSDSYDYKWTTGIRINYQSTISGGTVTGTGGNVYVGDSGYNSIQSVGVEFVALNMSAGTVTGNAGDVDKPQNNYSIGVNITGSSTVSGTAKINGTGLTAGVNCSNETITVSGDAAITGTGKTGIDLKYLSMPAEENNAVVTGISNASENGTGIYLIGKGDNESVLAGGKLNATAPETGNNHIGLRSLGTITTTGTLITAKGGSKAMEIEGNSASKNIVVADVIVVSENYSGTGKKALSIGGHTSEELASYRYAEAGNRSELGFEPTKRSLSEAVITLTETLTYNGSEQTQGFTVNVAEVELTAGEHFTVTGEKATDAGTYCITLTAKDGTDYTGTVTKEYTINKKKINATVTVTITGGPYVYVEGGVVPPDANVIVTYDGAVLVKDKDYYYSVNGNRVGSGTDGGYILVAAAPEGNYDFYQSTGYYTIVKGTNPAVVQSSTIVGVGKQNELSSLVSGYDETPEFEIIGETLGCTITWNGGFTAGTSVGEVKVQVTFKETSYYHSRTEIITVTVVEEGGVSLWGYVTGSTEDKVTLQLLQDSVVKYETTIPGNNAERYFIYGVAAGTYTLRARKENHLDYETTVVIGNDNLQANVDFKLGSGDKKFAINSAYLNLNQDINVIYRTTVPDGFIDPYMVFEFCDREEIVEEYFVDTNGRLCFAFSGVNPQRMGENICATLYATAGESKVSVCIANYSVRQYCVNQLNKNPNAKLLQMISDLLVYGEKTQIYQNYKTEELVTKGLSLSPSTFAELSDSYNVQSVEGTSNANVRYSGAGLTLSNDMTLRLKITSTNPSAYTYEVSINGRTSVYTYEDLEDNGDGTYYLYFSSIKATEFDAPITAVIKQDGVQTSQVLTYSVCTYIQKNQNVSNTQLRELLIAIYNYGESAKLYAN